MLKMFNLLAVPAVGRSLTFYKLLTPVLIRFTASFNTVLCQSSRNAEMLINRTVFNIPSAPNSSKASGKIVLNRGQKESVSEQLKLFDDSLSMKSMVFLLGWVGRTVNLKSKDLNKALSNQELSALMKLLNAIECGISQLEHRELAVVVWSLAKMKAHHHTLIEVCENEIISRGLGTFDYRSLSQIAWAFSKLHQEKSSVFEEIEKAIMSKEVNLAFFDVRGLAQTLVAFGVTNSGSAKLFQICAEEILSRDFTTFRNRDLVQIVWSFAKRGAEADGLFDKTEAELFRRGVSNIRVGGDIAMLLWSIASAGKKKEELVKALESQLLRLRNMSGFSDRDISDAIWGLERVGGNAGIKKLQLEVERRGRGNGVAKEEKGTEGELQ